jgi:hypothetical protein
LDIIVLIVAGDDTLNIEEKIVPFAYTTSVDYQDHPPYTSAKVIPIAMKKTIQPTIKDHVLLRFLYLTISSPFIIR